jgi:hypothetical protein
MQRTSPVASGATGEVKAARLLLEEAKLIGALMYRNKNQHGRARYFKKMEVRKGSGQDTLHNTVLET